MSHRWRPTQAHVSPIGVPHTVVTRTNVLTDPGQSTLEVARSARVCESSVRRYRKRVADTGSVAPEPHTGGPAKILTRVDAYALYLMTMARPSITREEAQAFLVLNRAKHVSLPTVSREWQRMGLTQKRMKFYSIHREEVTRGVLDRPCLARSWRARARRRGLELVSSVPKNQRACDVYVDVLI